MLFVLLFIYGKRAVMLFKRRLYNLTRVFRPGMLAVLIEGFSGAARNQVIYTPFCPEVRRFKTSPRKSLYKSREKDYFAEEDRRGW